MVNFDNLISLTCMLLSVSLIIQYKEYLEIRSRFGTVWKSLPVFVPIPLMIIAGIICSFGLFFNVIFVIPLLFLALLWAIYFRGSFNGGSDFMTVTLLLGLTLSIWNPKLGLGYIAVQSIFSYVISGFSKLKNPEWRNGKFIFYVLNGSSYDVPPLAKALAEKTKWHPVLAWGLMLFEITFPLALMSPRWMFVYMLLGIYFHATNSFVLGLNRFYFVWIATYPAIYVLANGF